MPDPEEQPAPVDLGDPSRAVAVLRNIPVLAGVSDGVLAELGAHLVRTEIDAGEWLFRVGEPSDSLYVVESGRLAVMDESGGLVREIGRGSPLGELGVIAGEPRSASVMAVRDSALWRMSSDAFWQLFDDQPAFQRALLGSVSSLLRASHAIDRDRRLRVFAVIPSSERAPLEEATAALEQALRKFGSVAVVRDDGSNGASRRDLAERYGPALDRAEQHNDWVILAGSQGETWRDFATTQADRIVIVAGDPEPPSWLAEPLADPTDLVLCTPHINYVAWWDAVDPASQVHVGSHPTAPELAPLARRLAGRSIGIVLSGGGARGLAHLGVYEELLNSGVHLDRFGGTSAGALGAAVGAMGMTPEEATEALRRYVVQPKVLSDYTVPIVSLIRAGRIETFGQAVFGDTLIEELPKSVYTVSADMVSGTAVIHRRGSLWTAVRASISIPGVMPPVPHGDQLLVDGGLLNNIPADIMAVSPDGPIICVDLRRSYAPSSGFSIASMHPPTIVRQVITGTTAALPSLQETLMRAVDLAASYVDYEHLPHVTAVIRPEVSHIGILNLGEIDSAIEAGRVATRAVLEAHPELVG